MVQLIAGNRWASNGLGTASTVGFRRRRPGTGAMVFALVLAGTASAGAQAVTPVSYRSLAPKSIAINTTGMSSVPMVRAILRSSSAGVATSISSMTITLTGTVDRAAITDVRVYYEAPPSVGTWNVSAGWPDLAAGTVTFGASNTLTIPISPTANWFNWGGNDATFYVVFDFASTASTSATAGCEIASVVYGAQNVGTGGTYNFTAHGQTGDLDAYATTLTATGIAPVADQPAGTSKVPVLDLLVSHADTSLGTKGYVVLDSIKLRRVGGYDSDITTGGVVLYDDTGSTPGSLDASDQELVTATLSGGYVTLNPASDLIIATGGTRFFVTVNLNQYASALPHTFGLEVESPSTDLVFKDVITDSVLDSLNGNLPTLSAEFTNQIGYITASSATPTTGKSFTVVEPVVVDTTPPVVTQTAPVNGSTGVYTVAWPDPPGDPYITATFDDAMDASTINGSTFTLYRSSTQVLGTVSYEASTRRAIFVPDSRLLPGTVYTATISSGVRNAAPVPLSMVEDKVWTFTTESAPALLATTPLNGAASVEVTGTSIDAIFSREMDPVSLEGSPSPSFSLTTGGSPVGGTVTYGGGTATFSPSAGRLNPGALYTASVTTTAKDVRGNALAATSSWTFSTESRPQVTITSPYAGQAGVATTTSSVSATFTKEMEASTLEGTTNLKLEQLSPVPGVVPGTVVYVPATSTVRLDISAGRLDPNATYRITIKGGGSDGAGTECAKDVRFTALAADQVWTFSTESSPQVTVTNPSPGVSGVAVTGAPIRAQFSKPMDATTLATASGGASFTLTRTSPGPVAVNGTVTYDGTWATFAPTDNGGRLVPGATYQASISNDAVTGAKDPNGNAIADTSARTWSFTAELSPQVTATSPYNGQSNVLVTTGSITATFSKTMLESTLDSPATTFTLVNTTAEPDETVTGTVDASGTTVSFVPDLLPTGRRLKPGTSYTALIGTAATDLNGNPLPAAATWSFVTESEPFVTSVTPADSSVNVDVRSAQAVAVFAKSMDEASVEAGFAVTIGATPVDGVVDYVAGTKTVSFVPTGGRWSPGVEYTATLPVSIVDTSGVPLPAPIVWRFTTESVPTVILTAPYSGEMNVSVSPSITAKFSKDMDKALVEASGNMTVTPDGGTAIAGTVVYDTGARVATFTPGSTLQYSKGYTVTIGTAVKDGHGIALAAPCSWSFATRDRPGVASTTPFSNAQYVAVGSAVRIAFSQPMSAASVAAAFSLAQTTPAGGPVSGTMSGSGQSFTFTPDTPLGFDRTYTATLAGTAADLSGNTIGTPYVWSFTTATNNPPQVLSTVPFDAQTNVSAYLAEVQATFSEPLDPDSVDDTVFTLHDGATQVPGHVSLSASGSILTFTPTAGRFSFQKTYTATITTGAKDLDGFGMASPYSWTFSTPAIVRPTVLSTSPASGAGTVSVRTTKIQATFSEALDEATVSGGVFTVAPAGGAALAGTVSYASSVLTFTLAEGTGLAYGTTYTASITTAVKDLDGFAMSAAYSWTFTTEPLVRPAVVSTSPSAGADDVAITTTALSVTFSKALDETLASGIVWSITASGGPAVTGTAAYADSVLRITLSRNLAYSTTYTVTIRKDNVKDADGIGMAEDFTWSFTTLVLNESLAVNNRIVPGDAERGEVRIFVPSPPAGAEDDLVTVAVFSARGTRVATLVSARRWEDIMADLPILWDGTNGRSQKLAPGLYFIQITAPGFKKTLKVLITG